MNIKEKASQPKKHSLFESLANVVVGFIIGLISNEIVLPLFGMHPSFWDSFWVAIVFTVISIVRSYSLRRFFNWVHIHQLHD